MKKKKINPNQVNYYAVTNGGVAIMPNAVLENWRYAKLTHSAKVILNYIAGQYRGLNNGDLSATLSTLKRSVLTAKTR